jgi:hypothetical protein
MASRCDDWVTFNTHMYDTSVCAVLELHTIGLSNPTCMTPGAVVCTAG